MDDDKMNSTLLECGKTYAEEELTDLGLESTNITYAGYLLYKKGNERFMFDKVKDGLELHLKYNME